jgi:hypothetical protein
MSQWDNFTPYASKVIGTPVDLHAVAEAEDTAHVLSGAKGEYLFYPFMNHVTCTNILVRTTPWYHYKPGY